MKPVFYLLAGPNGAGKSTLYKALLAAGKVPEGAEFINTDLHEAEALQHIADLSRRSETARRWAAYFTVTAFSAPRSGARWMPSR